MQLKSQCKNQDAPSLYLSPDQTVLGTYLQFQEEFSEEIRVGLSSHMSRVFTLDDLTN